MAALNFQKLALKAMLSLPRPVLRAFAGGGVVYQGGRTLDPRLQFISANARSQAPMTSLSPEEARLANNQGVELMSGRPEKGVEVSDITVESTRGPVPARVYRPEDQDPAFPLLVYAHMGGGVIGDLETCHVFCTVLASLGRCAVLSVDYRLAPENRYPAGLEDFITVYRWARDHAEQFGAPEGRAAVGGDSMGGNFAAIVAQEMKRTGEPQPDLQLLIYPCVDVASETQSMTTYAEAFPLSTALMDWFMGHYLGPDANPSNPRLSPLKSADLAGLAPTLVVTAGFDPLVDQGEAYAHRLKEAGAHVIYRCYDHLTHGFTAFTGAVPAADIACREIAGWVREAFEGRL